MKKPYIGQDRSKPRHPTPHLLQQRCDAVWVVRRLALLKHALRAAVRRRVAVLEQRHARGCGGGQGCLGGGLRARKGWGAGLKSQQP